MNRIKVIKKSEIITGNSLSAAPKIPDAQFNQLEMNKTVGNWVNDWRDRKEMEKHCSFDSLKMIKSQEQIG